MILDVGCGDHPRGNVNVDLYRNSEEILKGKTVKTKADVIAFSECLPFRNKVFTVSYACSVLEHTTNPEKAFSELVRVTQNELRIMVPHRFSRFAKMKAHKSYFTRTWWATSLNNLGLKFKIKQTTRKWGLLFYVNRIDDMKVTVFLNE
jgi:ubiquinone/menaquinone biosynthesis C-methylase UbiE